MIHFPVISLNDLWAWPNNVTRPRPLRPSALWRASDGFAEILGELSGAECTGQGNDFELIPTVKMETRHPVEG